MPSFDVVSEVDIQEVRNAVDQASRELSTRFDFKGTDSTVELKEQRDRARVGVGGTAEGRRRRCSRRSSCKRKVSLKALDYGKVEEATKGRVRQTVVAASRHQRREGARDRQVHQGARPQGRAAPGAGRPAARQRQEARRPADGDREAEGARLRHPAPVHELPRLTAPLGASLAPTVPPGGRRSGRRSGRWSSSPTGSSSARHRPAPAARRSCRSRSLPIPPARCPDASPDLGAHGRRVRARGLDPDPQRGQRARTSDRDDASRPVTAVSAPVARLGESEMPTWPVDRRRIFAR